MIVSTRRSNHLLPRRRWVARGMLVCGFVFAVIDAPKTNAGDVIKVPLRWCAVDGSPAVANPSGAPGSPPDTDTVLWNRHERAGDKIWRPQAKIAFRSGIIKSVKELANFPVIADPCPPADATLCESGDKRGFACSPDGAGQDVAVCGAGVDCETMACPANCPASCPGELGDLFGSAGGGPERDMMVTSCRMAWEALESELGLQSESLKGTIVVNAREVVNATGAQGAFTGIAQRPELTSPDAMSPQDICNTPIPPPTIITATGASVLLEDIQFHVDPKDQLLAHELGHTLWLRHGNGLDDDNDGRYDPGDPGVIPPPSCDPQEAGLNQPASLMFPTFSATATTITDEQAMTAQAVAKAQLASMMDVPSVDLPFGVLGDDEPDPLFDAPDALDLNLITLGYNVPEGVATFAHGIRRNFPAPSLRDFLIFADWDNNSATGGAPALLGFDACIEGADLVTQVTVRTTPDGMNVPVARAWRFEQGSFTPLDSDSLVVSVPVDTLLDVAPPPEPDRPRSVVLSIASPVLLPPADVVPLQATARGDDEITVDRLADEDTGACSVPFRMLPPTFPVCSVNPEAVAPGSTITIAAAGLFEDDTAKVLLGDGMILTAETDGDGALSADVVVPSDAEPGERLLTVGTMGTALTADCSVTVLKSCDLDVNGRVDFRDIRRIAAAEGRVDRFSASADIDADGAVTEVDLGHCLLRCDRATCTASEGR